jgi:hypothetical protein
MPAKPQPKIKERSVKKESIKKMDLTRETVRVLNKPDLSQKELSKVAGGTLSASSSACLWHELSHASSCCR